MIDDDTELCSLLEQFFREQSIDSAFAHCGQAGLDRLRGGGIDLVILDVMLPGADGFEILKKIRMENAVPVIMLTARGEDVDRIICRNLLMPVSSWREFARFFAEREVRSRVRNAWRLGTL